MVKSLFKLVCVSVLVVGFGFAGIAQAENTTATATDWFVAATKSAVSYGLDVLAKTSILPLANASSICQQMCSSSYDTCRSYVRTSCPAHLVNQCFKNCEDEAWRCYNRCN